VLLFLSIHTVITVLYSFVSEGNVEFLQEEDQEGNMKLDLSAQSTNMGYLSAELKLEVILLSLDNKKITSNSTFIVLDRGEEDIIEISFFVPEYIVDKHDLKDGKTKLLVELNISTLWELFKITNKLKVVEYSED
jgi:hypothetical protein